MLYIILVLENWKVNIYWNFVHLCIKLFQTHLSKFNSSEDSGHIVCYLSKTYAHNVGNTLNAIEYNAYIEICDKIVLLFTVKIKEWEILDLFIL